MATISAFNGFTLNMDPNGTFPYLGYETGIAANASLIRVSYSNNNEEWFLGSFAYNGNGQLVGGTVTEYRLYMSGVLSLYISNASVNVADAALGNVYDEVILGSHDEITGSTQGDYLIGYGGNDTLLGLGGNDILMGGDGNDTLIGGNGSDTFWGGSGTDLFRINLDGSNFIPDIIKDFDSANDTIGIDFYDSGATLRSLASRGTLFENGTAATTSNETVLYDRDTGRVTWDAAGASASGRTVIATVTADPTGVALDSSWAMAGRGDFNSDGTDDLLWRNGNGDLVIWQMQNNAKVNGSAFGTADNVWRLADAVDFTGDGTDDLLWRNDASGETLIWQMANYGKVNGHGLGTIDPSWTVAGGGDFNNDGKADIIWSNKVTHEALIWTMDGPQKLGGNALGEIDGSWKLAGSGDFNNDGTDDLLWHNRSGEVLIWDMMNGVKLGGHGVGTVDTGWQIVSTVDTNADGTGDIVWHHSQTGEVLTWQMQNGVKLNGFLSTSANPEWSVVETGDFNNDGVADLVWRNQSERMAILAYDEWNQLNLNASDFQII